MSLCRVTTVTLLVVSTPHQPTDASDQEWHQRGPRQLPVRQGAACGTMRSHVETAQDSLHLVRQRLGHQN